MFVRATSCEKGAALERCRNAELLLTEVQARDYCRGVEVGGAAGAPTRRRFES